MFFLNRQCVKTHCLLVFLVFFFQINFINASEKLINNSSIYPKYCSFSDFLFQLEVADTPEKQAVGLMHRKSLPTRNAMLFIFPFEKRSVFWMKNTYVALDIIWLNKNKKVVYIKKGALPLNTEYLVTPIPAKYVLEINAGLADKLAIKIGDFANFIFY